MIHFSITDKLDSGISSVDDYSSTNMPTPGSI